MREVTESVADALNNDLNVAEAERLDFDDAEEIVVEFTDGRRCLLIVQPHWDD